MTDPRTKDTLSASRRGFLMTSTAATLGLGMMRNAHAAGSDTIKVGLVGCGGRGSGAAEDVCKAAGTTYNIKLHALADAFDHRLRNCRDGLKENSACKDKLDISDDRCFVGLDAYQKVIDCCDMVMLATPPGFRPQHIEATIKAGKHLFAEKPVAVDATGIRKVLAAHDEATKKGLSVITGTQRRHQAGYVECLKRIHDGAIGDIVGGQVYWNQGPDLGRQARRRAGLTPSTSFATGTTSSGCAAITSSSSTCITSTLPAGPSERTRFEPSAWAAGR